jgi:hypothetical protein
MNKIIILLISLAILGCNSPNNTDIKLSPENAYNEIINNLDSLYPGRGIDVFNEEEMDRPMAYGLILSAESNRYKYIDDSITLNRVRLCGEWLISNSDLNNNGIHGYGLADSWDAFSDSTLNPANQEYTITTAIAINGLIDWYNIEPDSSIKSNIYNTVLNNILPFTTNEFDSPLGIPAYSLSSDDKEYDVYNPATYLAGQLKRFASISREDSLKNITNIKSDKIISLLMSNLLIDPNGNIYWNYGIQINRPNDLVHACYIIEGIRDYSMFDSDSSLQWHKIFNHLNLFYSNNRWYEYTEKEYQNETRNSRLWALSMLMYSLSKEEEYDKIEETLWPQIQEYYLGNGSFKFKTNDNRKMIRQEAHLLLGLSYYLFNEKSLPNKK